MKSIKKLSLSINPRFDKAELERVLSALEDLKAEREWAIADAQTLSSDCSDEDYFPIWINCAEELRAIREEESYV